MKKSKVATHLRESSLAEFERRFVLPKEGRTLIVGSQIYGQKEDRRLRYADVVGVDMIDGPGVDRVLDLEEPLPEDIGTFDHVECMSVLEHSRRPWLLAANLERLMADGATIFVSTPWVWRFHGYPDDYFRYSREAFRSLFPNVEWESLMYASDKLRDDDKMPRTVVNDHPYLARTETVGFGVRLSREVPADDIVRGPADIGWPPSDDAE